MQTIMINSSFPRLSSNCFKNVRLIATDMDGTLTRKGKFTPQLLHALEDLAANGIQTVIVTGRSAGWVSGLVSYLPVVGAIAENGGVYFPGAGAEPHLLIDLPDLEFHRRKLAQTFHALQAEFPDLKESTDNRFRLTDWTFDIQGLSLDTVEHLGDQSLSYGWGFTYSTVQCHLKPLMQTKAHGLEQVLSTYFPECDRHQVVTVGDSPNDESLFDADLFPVSVGVANVTHYLDDLIHHPSVVTQAPEVDGFCELVNTLLHR